jgi:hypothetical protein
MACTIIRYSPATRGWAGQLGYCTIARGMKRKEFEFSEAELSCASSTGEGVLTFNFSRGILILLFAIYVSVSVFAFFSISRFLFLIFIAASPRRTFGVRVTTSLIFIRAQLDSYYGSWNWDFHYDLWRCRVVGGGGSASFHFFLLGGFITISSLAFLGDLLILLLFLRLASCDFFLHCYLAAILAGAIGWGHM